MATITRQSKYLYDSTGNSVLLPKVIIQDLMYPEEPASFDPDNDASVSKGAKAVASCLKGETLIVAGLNLKTNGGKVEAILTNDGLSLINNDASGNITLKTTNVKIGEGVSGNLNVEGQMTGKLLTVTGDKTTTSTINSNLIIKSDVSSSTKGTGALVVTGGLGVGGNINSGLNITATNGTVKGQNIYSTQKLTVESGGMEVKKGTSIFQDDITANANINATSTTSGKGVITAKNIVSNKRLTVGAEGVSVTGDSTFNNNVTVKQSAKAKVNNIADVYLGVPIGAIMMWPGDTAPDCWAICNGESIIYTGSTSSPSATSSGCELPKSVNSDGTTKTYFTLTKDETQRLIDIIKTKYGYYTALGSQWLCIPDFRGMIPIGAGTGKGNESTSDSTNKPNFILGESGHNQVNSYIGEYKHKLTANESGVQSHDHTMGNAGSHSHNILNNGGSTEAIYSDTDGHNDPTNHGCLVRTGKWTDGQVTIQSNGSHSHTINSSSADAINVHNNVQPYQTVHFIIKVK